MSNIKTIELTADTNIFTETFLHLADVFGANDKEAAEKFGRENFANMDEKGRAAFHHLFPAHNAAIGAARNLKGVTVDYEGKILAEAEAEDAYGFTA